MTSEITYAEVRFNRGPTASGIHPGSLAAPKQSTAPHKSNLDLPKLFLISLLILFLLLAITFLITFIKKVWSCCPKNWKPFSSNCYLISTESKSWYESKHHCSTMEAHLLVISSKDEQDFIIQNLKNTLAYYVGLSDPEGQRHWQWVDETPYNANVTFWHAGEPSDRNERCVILNYRRPLATWGWNDIRCVQNQMSVCEMMKIYL
uniref:C-type lectin domain family 4 member A n=1 Tax=Oryctolagus cuniculus TaxID=9986 RepID=A0A5F9DRI6_RABIT